MSQIISHLSQCKPVYTYSLATHKSLLCHFNKKLTMKVCRLKIFYQSCVLLGRKPKNNSLKCLLAKALCFLIQNKGIMFAFFYPKQFFVLPHKAIQTVMFCQTNSFEFSFLNLCRCNL